MLDIAFKQLTMCNSRAVEDSAVERFVLRIWWNWQTRYFEVVVGQPVQVQVLLCAPALRNLRSYLPGRR